MMDDGTATQASAAYAPRSPDPTSYAPRSPNINYGNQSPPAHLQQAESGTGFYPAYNSFDGNNYQLKQETSDYLAPPNVYSQPPQHQFAAFQPSQSPIKQEQFMPGMPDPDAKPEPLKPYPGEEENITVRTKFPVARIKRIVQADEDVGKVAQVTPVVVSKALELFMTSLALKSAAEAKGKGSKRVTSAHLKAAVGKDEQFDFLSEIVEKIPDAPAAKEKASRRRSASANEDEDDEAEAKPKRKAKPRGRRKKADDDE